MRGAVGASFNVFDVVNGCYNDYPVLKPIPPLYLVSLTSRMMVVLLTNP